MSIGPVWMKGEMDSYIWSFTGYRTRVFNNRAEVIPHIMRLPIQERLDPNSSWANPLCSCNYDMNLNFVDVSDCIIHKHLMEVKIVNTGHGTFEPVDFEMVKTLKKEGDKRDIFQKGEVIQIRNSVFKVLSIGQHEMRLKLMPNGTPVGTPEPELDPAA